MDVADPVTLAVVENTGLPYERVHWALSIAAGKHVSAEIAAKSIMDACASGRDGAALLVEILGGKPKHPPV